LEELISCCAAGLKVCLRNEQELQKEKKKKHNTTYLGPPMHSRAWLCDYSGDESESEGAREEREEERENIDGKRSPKID
jgi:hypothetical protein